MDVVNAVKDTAAEVAKSVGNSLSTAVQQQHAAIAVPSTEYHVSHVPAQQEPSLATANNSCQLSMPELLQLLRPFCCCDSTNMPPKEIISMVLENLGDSQLTAQCASMQVLHSARHIVTTGLGLGMSI